jgi:hypothetical protein
MGKRGVERCSYEVKGDIDIRSKPKNIAAAGPEDTDELRAS